MLRNADRATTGLIGKYKANKHHELIGLLTIS
jgi:hypothetical protein